MSHQFNGERTLMRIFVGENDKSRMDEDRGRPLYEALLEFFRKRDFAGATAIRAIAGFGAHSRIHTSKILRLSMDLPIIIEVVAREEEIQAVLPELDRMIDGGLVTLERARVIMYRPHDVAADERWEYRTEGLEPDGDGPAST